ncbi:MAG: hypothetical protein ACTS3F_13740 [Phycisphaerales bacterium]
MEGISNCLKRRARFLGGFAAVASLMMAAPALAGVPCQGDLDGNGAVNSDDLGILLSDFGCTPSYDGPCAVAGPNGAGLPGCSADLACEAVVCAIDPFCCNNQWDGICADEAADLCVPQTPCAGDIDGDGDTDSDDLGILLSQFGCTPTLSCGSQFAGSCCENNGTPFCDDAVCCDLICAADPFCCNTAWDQICADAAIDQCVQCFACGSSESGDCCEANGTPYCNNAACCETVCAVDPFCCDTEWDGICADEAAELCGGLCGVPTGACCLQDGSCQEGPEQACVNNGGTYQGDGTDCASVECPQPLSCGSPEAGSCCESNGTPFCDDAACCDLICAADPFCCDTAWDTACANQAIDQCEQCFACGSSESGSCCESNGTPFCNDAACCETVCASDPFCCNNTWDSLCAEGAAELCGTLCGVTGACCLGDGSCQEGTEQACVNNGGTYQGDGTDCASVACPQACGTVNAGDCCVNNGTPFCNDAACCDVVCAVDPFCCNNTWDQICADAALEGCFVCGAVAGCGVLETGDCCVDNDTPYCNDAACCEAICAGDPFCCDTQWDQICADAAIADCAVCAP